ncbi:ARM repeat-containing protein [Hypoxylon cercidicola]|nr:ARM repeat-containing protein [Hypoxylon cercidicola]
MNFAIEVPGAATPFNFHELCRTLQFASSHDNSERQSATQQLQTWESDPAYYPSLQSVFLDQHVSQSARLLAIIQLKNGIDRHWRQYAPDYSIPAASKQAIRDRLFQGTVGEGDRHLAQLNALVVAKVVRIDFPHAWASPFTDLNNLLRTTKNGNQLDLSGALMILLRVVKELGTARMLRSQKALQTVTPELVYILGEIYGARTSEWIAFLTNGQDDIASDAADVALLAMENSLDAIKILRRLLLVGYDQPHKDKGVQEIWSFSQGQLAQFLDFINGNSPKIASYTDFLGKHLMQFTKLHLEMAEQHPAAFASLPNSLDLARAYWNLTAKFAEGYKDSGGLRQEPSSTDGSKAKTEGPLLEKLALKGLLLVRACVRMVHYQRHTIRYRSKELVQEHQQAMEVVKTDLLKDDLVIQIANVIISQLFIFRKSDMDAWEQEPQEWEEREESQGSAWEWEVRPCAEKLFLDLLTHYKTLLQQPLLSYFTTAQNQQADIIAKEAVYTAMGLAAPVIYEGFDFDAMLRTTIVADAQQTGQLCQVLRRRIAILLSQWVPVKVTKESRPLIYEIFRHFLNPADSCNDIVVRTTAARQFKAITDEFGFEGELFIPYASDVLTRLLNLLEELDIDETKLAILETTRSLIQRMETHVSHFGDQVMGALPGIWESAGELGFMMKQSVLAIMQTLVTSMRSESLRYHSMILPLIAEATREDAEMYVYLIDEALELWTNILIWTPSPLSPEVLSLADTAIKELTKQNEHAKTLTSILGSYILLAPEAMLEDRYRVAVLSAFCSSLGSKDREQIGIATRYAESFIVLSHELGGAPGLRVVVQDMMRTGFITKMLEDIHDAFEAHKTSGPKKRYSRVSGTIIADYFSVLSRIAVIDPAIFVEMLTSLGPLDQVWIWLSAEWFGSLDTTAHINQRKLSLLALTRLTELPESMQEIILHSLQDYFSMWTSVLAQILDREDKIGNDELVLTAELEPTEWDTPKDVRERALFASDPVKRVQSLPFVTERLNDLIRRVGGDQAFQDKWAVNVDREVLVSFQALVTLSAPPNGIS